MIILTHIAQQRLQVLHALDRGELRMVDAAQLTGLSIRQVRRLRRAYRKRGPRALVHGNRGHPSPRRIADAIRERLIRLARTTYADINFQHLSELLAEREGLTLSRPTIHRILRAAGLRSPRRRRPPRHRRRRERMPQAGLLVQLDGSHHAWLARGPRLTLLAALDDATGEVLAAEFRAQEDTHGYLSLFRTIAQTKGIPVAVYSDRHSIFHRNKRTPLTLAEQLRGGPDPTQVGRALHELGIRWIPASSPQAKGRIERLFATFQDRLRAELRLARVHDREDANSFLADFLPRYHARFVQPAAHPTPAYRPWPVTLDPETVFCFKYRRGVANDNTVTLGPHHVQILSGTNGRSYAKASVELHERLDGSLAIYHQGQRLLSQQVTTHTAERIPARKYPRVRLLASAAIGHTATRTNPKPSRHANRERAAQPWKPAPDHPWRHMPGGTAKPRPSRRGRTKSLNP